MKEKILTEGNILKIKEYLQIELLKRGISAPITFIEEVATPTRNGINFETENFQTIPVMFKSLKVTQFGSNVYNATLDNGRECVEVVINVSYSYHHFSGGSNFCELFYITFRLFCDSVHLISVK